MIIQDRSKRFAVDIVRFYKYLTDEKAEHVLSRQLLRSGTAIGANIAEAANAQSDKDFLSKISIALKECTETKYWLEVLVESGLTEQDSCRTLYEACIELQKLLTRTVKTTKQKLAAMS